MKRFLSISCSLALVTIGAAVATAQPAPEGGRPIEATLGGAAEIPGPGDSDGSGTFAATVNPGQGLICYKLTAQNIQAATAAHIHVGPVGVAGPVVVPLAPPGDGDSEACASADRELALNILKDPAAYYVNVHNPTFPAGAIRGQLTKR